MLKTLFNIPEYLRVRHFRRTARTFELPEHDVFCLSPSFDYKRRDHMYTSNIKFVRGSTLIKTSPIHFIFGFTRQYDPTERYSLVDVFKYPSLFSQTYQRYRLDSKKISGKFERHYDKFLIERFEFLEDQTPIDLKTMFTNGSFSGDIFIRFRIDPDGIGIGDDISRFLSTPVHIRPAFNMHKVEIEFNPETKRMQLSEHTMDFDIFFEKPDDALIFKLMINDVEESGTAVLKDHLFK